MNQERKNLLVFGYGLPVILTVIGLLNMRKHGLSWFNETLFALAVVVLSITVFNQPLLKIIYTKWMKVAHFIGQIMTTVLLAVVFYLIFTPVGLVLRLMRKDYMDRKLQPEAKSYWHLREKKPFDKERATKQF